MKERENGSDLQNKYSFIESDGGPGGKEPWSKDKPNDNKPKATPPDSIWLGTDQAQGERDKNGWIPEVKDGKYNWKLYENKSKTPKDSVKLD